MDDVDHRGLGPLATLGVHGRRGDELAQPLGPPLPQDGSGLRGGRLAVGDHAALAQVRVVVGCGQAHAIDERQRDSLAIRDDDLDIPPFLR